MVAEEIERLADADERLRLVTVTAVDTAPDLRHATVYLSSLTEEAAAALARAAGPAAAHRRPPGPHEAHPAARVRESTRPWWPATGSTRRCAGSTSRSASPADAAPGGDRRER